MNILINFSTLKSGGGQNVGLNFLQFILKEKNEKYNFFFVVAKNSRIQHFLLDNHQNNFITAPNSPIKRLFFEIFNGRKILKKYNIDIIYTYFGYGFYPRKVPQIVGSADSNLYFPEMDFWQEFKGGEKVIKIIIDQYRIWGLKRASGIIFENEAMEKRCHEIYKITNTIYIKPSINLSLTNNAFLLPTKIDRSSPKGLFLCGWQRNKNINAIPKIAFILKQIHQPFHFILTAAQDGSKEYNNFKNDCKQYNVEDMISLVGVVKKEELSSLYEQIDYVFLLSKLESFSNNIIEAWYFQKLLFITDAEWSKAII